MSTTQSLAGRPERTEAGPYYFTYIDRIATDDVVGALEGQLDDTLKLLGGISEEKSRHRYAADKWSIRELLGHVNDAERVFSFRAFWFARGHDSALPSFEENACVAVARSQEVAWARHVEEFRLVRQASVALFRNLPAEAWMKSGVASDLRFTVRALAYIVGGHLSHHRSILEERYL